MASTSDLTDYHGNCHCGIFKFRISIPELKSVITCKCSFCLKSGIVWSSLLPDEALTIENGDGELSLYEFGAKTNQHCFCPKCGSSVFSRGKGSKGNGINIRMLKDVDWEILEKEEDAGALAEPAYEPPSFSFSSALGEIDEGMTVYNGNCHCKTVKYAVKTKPLKEQEVVKCNCSLCSRNGDHFIYPPASSVILEGQENLEKYAFLDKKSLHSFCKTCGVSVCVQVLHMGKDLMPLNVRTFDGIDLEGLKYKKYDGAKNKPLYAGEKHSL